ncbi:MAG: glycosyltransferase, partial [Pseudomonadota bacterium]
VPLTPLVLRQDQSSEATGLSAVAYLAAGLEHRFVPPGQIARWLSTLPPEVQQQAITALRESETGLATLPVLSWLPAIALPLDPAQLIAAADIAARQGRRQTALAWLRRLATCAAVPSMQTARAADIAETLGSYDALSLASDWRGALQSIDPTPATIARLEQRLVERNPLRSRAKLDKALSELRQAAEAGLREDPQDSARAIAMAHALALGGEPDRAADLLAECHAREPSNADVLTEWMLHVERTDNPKKVCEIAAKRLALGYDENAALSDLRARRAVGEARAIPERVRSYGDAAGLLVRNEHPRNCFFLGEFTDALRAAEALLDEEPKSRPTRALAIAAAIELGALETAEHHVSYFDPGDDDVALMERDLFQYEISEQRARATATAPISSSVLAPLNRLFARYGCQPLALDGSKRFGLSALVGAAEEEPACLAPLDQSYGPAPLTEGPLVSVIMTSFNSAQYVETAIRSILDQSYTPIEMIVVDDASTDATPEILRRLERTHPQLRTILKPTNEGTYVSKNQALREARGTYVAFQDSDDWSHPDRIGKSVAALESNCDIVGLTTDWLRMTSDGQIVIKPGGQISHVCCISLVFRRETVLNRAGFFDSVRVEADHEYIRRIRLLFGRHAVARLRWPLLIGRAHAASLTADPAFGIKRTGFTEPRLDYQRAYRVWHEEIRSGDASGFLAFPLPERPFSAPPMILPHHLPSTAAGTPAEQDA